MVGKSLRGRVVSLADQVQRLRKLSSLGQAALATYDTLPGKERTVLLKRATQIGGHGL